jgi:ParB-like chromosome segregation protein Spo0J
MNELKLESWDIERVIPYEKNVKIHDEKQIKKIAASIELFGWDQPIVVDKDGVIIKGHGRRLAALSLGLKKVPVLCRADLDEDQVKASRVADNRVAMGDIDTETLQKELREINMELDRIFDSKELRFMELDLTEINEASVEVDIVGEMERQSSEMVENIKQAEESDVRVTDVLGFKKIKGSKQRAVARFMARIEEETEALGAEAFVTFAENYIK